MNSDQSSDSALKPVVETLDETVDAESLAGLANYSTAQYYRIVKKHSPDPPMAVRRRLLLERSAFELTRTQKSISEIGMEAGFESLEGFSRSFKGAFGVAPRYYRRLSPSDYRIDARERIHYAPPAVPIGPRRQGELNMKLLERLIEHHRWSMHRILDACRVVNSEEMEREWSLVSPFPWDPSKETLHRLLCGNVGFARPWLHSINNEELQYDKTIDGLHEGLDLNCDKIMELARSIEAQGRWDLTFIDALCEPPEVFSFIGVFGHMVTYNAYRRTLVLNHLRGLGITGLGFGDPIEFDSQRREAG